MAQSNAVTRRPEGTDSAAIQRSTEYYYAILEGSGVYHIASDGATVCSLTLAEQESRWFKRGSEAVIPRELRLCERCDAGFHRELARSKAHIREELAELAGTGRETSGPFTKAELADLLVGLRRRLGPAGPEGR